MVTVAGQNIVVFLKERLKRPNPYWKERCYKLWSGGGEMNVMAIDLETKNMSYEIGGFGNTHMFQVSTVTTWDGSTERHTLMKPLMFHKVTSSKACGPQADLDDFQQRSSISHNIAAFDHLSLEILDTYCIRKYLENARH